MSTDTFADVQIDETIKINIDEPQNYKVIMLNDDSTPMEWVVDVLKSIFNHSQETAEKIMLQIHDEDSAVAGIYTYEIAEQKVLETVNSSRQNGFPLAVSLDTE
jgi:ATP-dependent Clp protease adaptor protein ClpS|tara:strand:+ start:343 stop:654 length:312 start_codon:yes stop_codon:yes gene_type:complete